mgnify:CR=1 FL=1
MTTTEEHHREAEHKVWLNDIERWKYDFGVWEAYRQTLEADIQSAVAAAAHFAECAKEHDEAVHELQRRILACERDAVEHKRSEDELQRSHSAIATEFAQQRDQHSRLEKQRHDLISAIKSFRT